PRSAPAVASPAPSPPAPAALQSSANPPHLPHQIAPPPCSSCSTAAAQSDETPHSPNPQDRRVSPHTPAPCSRQTGAAPPRRLPKSPLPDAPYLPPSAPRRAHLCRRDGTLRQSLLSIVRCSP